VGGGCGVDHMTIVGVWLVLWLVLPHHGSVATRPLDRQGSAMGICSVCDRDDLGPVGADAPRHGNLFTGECVGSGMTLWGAGDLRAWRDREPSPWEL
jgi:hypothetical protein